MGYLLKFILGGFLGLFLHTSLFGQSQWEVVTPKIDLGEVLADEREQETVFLLKNRGKHPIIIHQVTPMNPMIRATWDRTPVPPGKTVEIHAHFVSSKLSGPHFNYKIIVLSNAQNKRQELYLSGHLVDNPQKPELLYKQNINGLLFKSKHISIGNVYNRQTKNDTIHFFNKCPKTIKLSSFRSPSHIEPIFIPSEVKKGEKGAIVLKFHGTKKKEYGYSYEPFYFYINNEFDLANCLYISATLTEDFSSLTAQEMADAPIAFFKQKEFDFGKLGKGKKKNCPFTLTNNGNTPLYIRTAKTSCGCTAVTLPNRAINPKETITIQIVFDATGKTGYQNKTITIITNDPKNPETILRIKGEVK